MPSNGLQEVDFLHPKLSKVIEYHRGLLLADLRHREPEKEDMDFLNLVNIMWKIMWNTILVGGFNPSEKY
jgi:hypothetical protein